MAEFYEGFAAVYDQWAEDMTEDVPFTSSSPGRRTAPWSSWPWAAVGSQFLSRGRSGKG